MVKQFPKGSDVPLSEHFSSREFDCHCTSPECDFTYVDTELVESLEVLRGIVGPLVITSGFRCTSHNRASGGKPGSLHLLGKAADVARRGLTGKAIAMAAESVPVFARGGIGRADSWAHLDVRKNKVRWSYP